MCFSAGASFGAGIGLSVIGLVSLRKAGISSQTMFAAIPLLFSVQQITEGLLWLALTRPAYASWEESTTFGFLVFAQVLWPFWVPFSMLLMEPEKKEARILQILSIMGAIVAGSLAYCLFSYPVHASVKDHHIAYDIGFPAILINYFGVFYILVTAIPPFFSHTRSMWVVGVTILASYLFTKFFFAEFVISVWCFFAAIISVVVLYIMREMQNSPFKKGNLSSASGL